SQRDLPKDNLLVSVEVLRWQSAPASDHSKSKRTIESRAKRSSKIISLGHNSTLLASSYTVKIKAYFKSPTHYACVGFNSLVHSLRALSALRRSGLRTASTAAKLCQGDSSEFYLITCRIPTVAAAGQKDVNSQLNAHSLNLPSMNSKKTYNTASATLTYAVMIQDRLLFDYLLTPPPSVDPPAPEVIAPIDEVIAPEPAESTGSPSLTTVEQDAPSPSKSQTTPETQPPVIPHDVEEDNHDIEVAHMGNDPFFGMPILEVASDKSSSTNFIHVIEHPDHQISQHNSKWTKDHPLENIIAQLVRLVSTRLQLHEQAFFCYYDAFLTSVEPTTYKDALTQSCWIEAMQEELNEFERLKVWELVPRPDKVMVITLK
nr:hypothetical protein [Tanacetum cinerariifolium]